ncbi:hypothetical protein SUGI_0102090 [Cryptomeria japonica]|nr:hypothetical protein SUGI_0102090 [Cryptomeria japonica]
MKVLESRLCSACSEALVMLKRHPTPCLWSFDHKQPFHTCNPSSCNLKKRKLSVDRRSWNNKLDMLGMDYWKMRDKCLI